MSTPDVPSLRVDEIRDYTRINVEVLRLLEAGNAHVILAGVDGQRLLLFGLKGAWTATVELLGAAGPEIAAEMDAPGLAVVCHGGAADGAGRGLRAGHLIVGGDVADAVGYDQRGGTIVAAGGAGHRAGLGQSGGTLVIRGSVGRLAAERQSGGTVILIDDSVGASPGWGRRGGRLVGKRSRGLPFDTIEPADRNVYDAALRAGRPWLAADWPELA